jgi:hypothetical protein
MCYWMASDAGCHAPHQVKGKVCGIFSILASPTHCVDLLKHQGIGTCQSQNILESKLPITLR